MSHTIKILGNRSSKNNYREYLSHKDEPKGENHYRGTLAELDAEVVRTTIFEKRKFRRTARRLRRYAI